MDLALAADASLSIAGFDRIILIYSGVESGGANALTPSTQNPQRFVYQVGEKTSLERGRTPTVGTFYGIGTHVHEFGHLLHLPDLKRPGFSDHKRGVSEFGLMGVGNQGFMDGDYTGTSKGGLHAPTPLCGWSKLSLGWANYEEFVEGNVTFPSFEDNDQMCVYFINDANHDDWDEGEYFIFENRRTALANGARSFDGDMFRGSTTGGLLIFRHRNSGLFNNNLRLEVIEADNSDGVGTSVAAARMEHFYPGITDNTEFSRFHTK